jgi:hypothetical protein
MPKTFLQTPFSELDLFQHDIYSRKTSTFTQKSSFSRNILALWAKKPPKPSLEQSFGSLQLILVQPIKKKCYIPAFPRKISDF